MNEKILEFLDRTWNQVENLEYKIHDLEEVIHDLYKEIEILKKDILEDEKTDEIKKALADVQSKASA